MNWNEVSPKDFWGEIAPCEHVLQIYENSEILMQTLAGFVGDGINSGDCTIVIATREHLKSLESILTSHGINMDSLRSEDLYIGIDANEALSTFMVKGWPDSFRFFNMVSGLFRRARKKNRSVRAFGEMVALLWARGDNGATVQLEHLWNEFCTEHQMTLFCAYPKSGFTENPQRSMDSLCHMHSRVICGSSQPPSKLLFKTTEITF